MDDKTFVAKYVADETTRLSDTLKEMVARAEPPSEQETEKLAQDMEATLVRLKSALSHLYLELDEPADKEPV